MAAFVWGNNGEQLTPEQVERKRLAALLMGKSAQETTPVASPFAGLNRALQGYLTGRDNKRADAQEASGLASGKAAFDPIIAALTGGGSGGSNSFGGGSSGTWTPNAPAPKNNALPPGMGKEPLALDKPAMPSEGGGGLSFGSAGMTAQEMIIAGSEARGLNPIDVATAISYETGGTFDPTKGGPTTQWGQHRGLIQFGEPQAAQYGVDFSTPESAVSSQLDPKTGAVWKYLEGAGVEPGMGLPEVYSAINAGSVGRMGASDANNGGAPGTVADKVAGMGDHRAKAAQYLGGTWTPNDGGGNVTMSTKGAPQGGQSNILGLLLAAQSDPWAAKQYGPVMDALLGSELQTRQQNADPLRHLQIRQAEMELQQMQTPQQAKPIEVGGVLLDPNTYEPIFDSRVPDALPVAPRPLSDPQERASWGIPATDTRPYAIEDGKPPQLIGGGGVTVNNDISGGGKFEEAFAKGDADTIATVYNSGLAAQRNLGRIDQLEGLLAANPTGMGAALAQKAGEWGINTEGLDEIQGAQALINSLVPEQRQPGSGPMSDADLALFKQSLPRIIQQPGGNKIIVDTMRGIAQYDAEGASIVQQLRNGDIDRATAFEMLQNRANPLMGYKPPAGDTPSPDAQTTAPDTTATTPPQSFMENPEILRAAEGNGLTPQELWDAMTPEQRAKVGG